MAPFRSRRKLYRADLAELAGIKVSSLGRTRLPKPDGYEIDGQYVRPYWWASTAHEWVRNRPGRGWRKGQR